MPVDLINSVSVIEKNQIDLFIHMTFPNHKCEFVAYYNNGQSESDNKFFRGAKFHKSPPTEYDYALATNQSTSGKSKKLVSKDPGARNACTIRGTMTVPKMEGDFGIRLNPTQWTNALSLLQQNSQSVQLRPMSFATALGKSNVEDTSFYIHDIQFGKPVPNVDNPLRNKHVKISDFSTVGLAAFNVKMIPTQYSRPARRVQELIQVSVSEYSIPAPILATTNPPKVPGFWMHYDVSPISVVHSESRENLAIFLSDVISIVGGVFVTVGLVSACLVHSASAVTKKMD
jgi:hypothetical protein